MIFLTPRPSSPTGSARQPSSASSAVGRARVPSLSLRRRMRMPLRVPSALALLDEEEREAGRALGRSFRPRQGQRDLARDGGGEPLRAPEPPGAAGVAARDRGRRGDVAPARPFRHPLPARPELLGVAAGEVRHDALRRDRGPHAPAGCARRRRSWPDGTCRSRSSARRGRGGRTGGCARRAPGRARTGSRSGPTRRPRGGARARRARPGSRPRGGPRRRRGRGAEGCARPRAPGWRAVPPPPLPGRARRAASRPWRSDGNSRSTASRSAGSASNVFVSRGGSWRNSGGGPAAAMAG